MDDKSLYFDLSEQIMVLEADIRHITDQLAEADMRRQETGHVDRGWVRSARRAITFKRDEIAILRLRRARLPNEHKRKRRDIRDLIVDLLRSRFSEDEFMEIVEKAKTLAAEMEEA